ncbi:hypothetical protein GDO81_020502 [Engystomops pustulosus]|uniref:Uncharacterized protein n=1 Tax=Engystomops pustulosus TaxID=76066 RepID=A0AAV6Z9N3_ENGPU|nr:hypothetical protein GDO81_020502 [Engystomops pustulosus]
MDNQEKSLFPDLNPEVSPLSLPAVLPTCHQGDHPDMNPEGSPLSLPAVLPTCHQGDHPDLNPEVSPLSLPAVLPACHQGNHQSTNGVDTTLLLETFRTNNTEHVSEGVTGNLCPMPIEESENSIKCPDETDVVPAGVTEILETGRQVNGAHLPGDCPIIFPEGRLVVGNGCAAGDVSEVQLVDTCMDVSALLLDLEPQLDLQKAQKTPDLPKTPNITEMVPQVSSSISQSDLQDSPTIKAAPYIPNYDLKVQERDGEPREDPKSLPQVIISAEETIPPQLPDAPSEDPIGLSNGLDVPDSQLLGALEESCEPGRSDENHISDYRQETPLTTTSLPRLPVTAALAQGTAGPDRSERRTEDASPTLQGLITELSNINRFIMSTYRELRQKRVRHVPGRASAGVRRRREM